MGDRAEGTVRLGDGHAGAPGIAHGGIVSAVIDEICGTCVHSTIGAAVTTSLTTRFRAPAMIGHDLRLAAWLDGDDGRRVHVLATIHDGELLVAEGEGTFQRVGREHFVKSPLPVPSDWLAFFDEAERGPSATDLKA